MSLNSFWLKRANAKIQNTGEPRHWLVQGFDVHFENDLTIDSYDLIEPERACKLYVVHSYGASRIEWRKYDNQALVSGPPLTCIHCTNIVRQLSRSQPW